LKVAKELNSNVLASNAYHHRVDGLTAVVALLMIVGSHYFSSGAWLDAAGGLAISWMVVQTGFSMTRNSLLELLDATFGDDMREKIRVVAAKALGRSIGSKNDAQIQKVEGTKSGQSYFVDVTLVVPPGWTVEKANTVEKDIRLDLEAAVKGVRDIRIHFISSDGGNRNR